MLNVIVKDKFPGILLTYFCVPFLIIPSVPINWYAFCFHFPRLSNFNFKIFIFAKYLSLAQTLLLFGMLISINWHVLFSLRLIAMSGLLDHLGSAPLWRILSRKFLVKRLWSCVVTINPSVSTLRLVLLSHWWVPCVLHQVFGFEEGIAHVTVSTSRQYR